jgi:hypothetical protein
MTRRTGLVAGGLLVIILGLGSAGVALAGGPKGQASSSNLGGMMGNWTQTNTTGSMMGTAGAGGMMGGSGYGGMMGNSGPGGMMSGWGAQGTPTGKTISLDKAQQDVQAYLTRLGNPDLAIDEVIEFQTNFYAIVKEKSTGTGAFELLVNKVTGAVFPEYGPDMMWNTKYGMMVTTGMGQMMGYAQPTGAMTVSVAQAKEIAQRWLDQHQPGSATETPDRFYGYYTVHTLKNGKITGMLSVNGYSGQVWYHTWHGAFIAVRDLGATSAS